MPVKTAAKQAQGMVLKLRETLIGQRVQLTNALRGHAAAPGIGPVIGLTMAVKGPRGRAGGGAASSVHRLTRAWMPGEKN